MKNDINDQVSLSSTKVIRRTFNPLTGIYIYYTLSSTNYPVNNTSQRCPWYHMYVRCAFIDIA